MSAKKRTLRQPCCSAAGTPAARELLGRVGDADRREPRWAFGRDYSRVGDTGAQTTLANLALRNALRHDGGTFGDEHDLIEGVTLNIEDGVLASTPRITVGGLAIQNARITFADMAIFDQWRLRGDPTLIIGMDVLGLLDTLIIDYRRHELQIRMGGVT